MPRFLALISLTVLAGVIVAACGGGSTETPVPTGNDADRPTPAADTPAPSPTPDRDQPGASNGDGGNADRTANERPSASNEPVAPGSANGAATDEYTVQAGDTLLGIALQFDTTVEELLALNNLSDADTLDVGQVLRIPREEVVAEGPAPDEGDAANTPDDATDAPDADEADSDAPDMDQPTPAPGPGAETGLGTSPETITQPGPDVTVEEVPAQPADFATYGPDALPWLQDRSEVDEIVPLFSEWFMPPVAGGDRLNLVDTDLDSLSSVVIIYTNPQSTLVTTGSNLVIYDPIPDRPERYRVAYDHNLATGEEAQDIVVLRVTDLTGDGLRDITFSEEFCGASTCTTSFHVLVRSGSGYRDAVIAPIAIPTVTSVAFEDRSGDGLADLVVEGGTFGSVSAGPPRAFRFVFDAAGETVRQVSQEGLPTTWRVWVWLDGNAALAREDFAAAATLYEQAATDPQLQDWVPEDAAVTVALSHLRRALALQGNTTAALAAAQTAAAGTGLLADLSNAFLSGFAGQTNVSSGCAAFNSAFVTRVDEWDAFWSQFGFGVPQVLAADLCPF